VVENSKNPHDSVEIEKIMDHKKSLTGIILFFYPSIKKNPYLIEKI
jgi:hypothetical protein